MRYIVEGGNRKQREKVDVCMSYVIQLLNIPDNVFVQINLGFFDSHGVMQTSPGRFDMEICTRLPGGFYIESLELAKTVFHEMKHIEQLTSKRLKYTECEGGFLTFWNGEDHSTTEYFDCPWEIEAYIFEKNAEYVLTRIAA